MNLPEPPELTEERLAIRRIVCAAIRMHGHIVIGPRHFDLTMLKTIEANPVYREWKWGRAEQGFIDQFGYFLNRDEAYEIAKRQGQIINDSIPDRGLFSEHLY